MKIVSVLIQRTALLSGIFSVAAFLVFSIFQILSFGQKATSELKTQLQGISPIVADHYSAGDLASLRATLAIAAESQGWNRGELLDTKQDSLWSIQRTVETESMTEIQVITWSFYRSILPSHFLPAFYLEISEPIQVNNDFQVGVLTAKRSVFELWKGSFNNLFSTSILFVAIWAIYLWLHWYLSSRALKPLATLARELKQEADLASVHLEEEIKGDEIGSIRVWFRTLTLAWKKSQDELVRHESLRATANLALQVSHDIRSPLSALNSILTVTEDLPEERRILIRNAVQRINDIANDLLSKGRSTEVKSSNGAGTKSNPADAEHRAEIIHVPALIDNLISEKRIQFREHQNIEIQCNLKNSYGAFVTAEAVELARIISNLLNNALESLQENTGRVLVTVALVDQVIEIEIQDSGCGIPEQIISQVGQRGFTFAKPGSVNGNGLGVHSAKQYISSLGGELVISSKVREGTRVKIILPKEKPPSWFPSEISVAQKSTVFCLDDDLAIHSVWKTRFDDLQKVDAKIELMNFTSANEFKKSVLSLVEAGSKSVFLIDYELLGQGTNGLEVISSLGLTGSVFLVTSRYEENEIQRRCFLLGVKLLPKGLSNSIPISLMPSLKTYDWVLIDDDPLVHMVWQFSAKEKQKSLISFQSSLQFKEAENRIDSQNSCLFIDSNLGGGERGEDLAKILFQNGWQNLYLTTGYDKEEFSDLGFLKGVIGKSPPDV